MRPGQQVDPTGARPESRPGRCVHEGCPYPTPAMVRLHPDGGDPGGVLGPALLVTDDGGGGAQKTQAIMGHERGGNRTGVQAVPHKTGEQVERMPGIFPEGAPDAIGNCVGKVRPVAQIADCRLGQRKVSSRRFISS